MPDGAGRCPIPAMASGHRFRASYIWAMATFDADALGAWWQAAHSVTTPRALGVYAIEWASTDFRDEILGRLGD